VISDQLSVSDYWSLVTDHCCATQNSKGKPQGFSACPFYLNRNERIDFDILLNNERLAFDANILSFSGVGKR